MKTLGKNAGEAEKAMEAEEGFFTPNAKIDFSKVKVEPLFEKTVDFETFSKSDFRAVKVKDCPPRPMMGIESCGMVLSAVNNLKDSEDEELHLLMVDNHIPAGAKLY